jgi:intracellular septation protein
VKILLDFLPIVLFFGAFKYADGHKEWAHAFANEHLGFLVSGGVVDATQAPVLLATVVVIIGTFVQVATVLLRGKKVDLMLWLSLSLVTVLGGATIWFHSDTFIKCKPSVLYWFMGLSLWISQSVLKKNLLQSIMGQQLQLPAQIWLRLNQIWIAFFAIMGLINLYVAYSFSLDTWVNFKLFGSTGLMFAFTVGQAIYVSKHIKEPAALAGSVPRSPE